MPCCRASLFCIPAPVSKAAPSLPPWSASSYSSPKSSRCSPEEGYRLRTAIYNCGGFVRSRHTNYPNRHLKYYCDNYQFIASQHYHPRNLCGRYFIFVVEVDLLPKLRSQHLFIHNPMPVLSSSFTNNAMLQFQFLDMVKYSISSHSELLCQFLCRDIRIRLYLF